MSGNSAGPIASANTTNEMRDGASQTESASKHDLYTILENEILPLVGLEAAVHEDIRLWIPECAAGETSYIAASACLTLESALPRFAKVKVFSTDRNDANIRAARASQHPLSLQELLPPHRRDFAFKRTSQECTVNPAVRAACVFAVHDIQNNPPFSKIDLIIWTGAGAQSIPLPDVMPIFHYSLSHSGLLLLDPGISLSAYSNVFEAVPDRPGLYRRKPGSELLPAVVERFGIENRGVISRNELRAAREQIRSANDELSKVIEEIEERNRELSRLNDDLVNLFGSINLPLLIVGNDLRIWRTNPAAERIFQLMPHDVGRPIDHMNLGIRVPNLNELISNVIATSGTHEQDVQDRDGRWYSMRIKPYISTVGGTEGAVLGLVDIDAIKQSRDRERKARAEAEAANRAKDQFLAVLSHELRTPLTPLLGWVKMLKSGKLDEAKRQHGLEIIERSVNAQSQLIEDLLDISRIVTGKLELKDAPVDLSSVLQSAIDYIQDSAKAKSIQVSIQADPIRSTVGDPDRLRQVFWNILVNAVKFTPCNGRIDIRLENLNTHVQLRVSDTGEGISTELLPHIFDRFRQGDSTITRKYSGLGIGLSIVRTIVALHNGTVRAESPGPGLGSTFIVTLPLRETDCKPDGAHKEPSASAPIDGARVLVVDDHAETREFVTVTLESAGATVMTADSVVAAFQSLESGMPDIVISDVGMPDEDGFSFIRKIRSLEKEKGLRPVPAIALTAFAMAGDRERALQAGFNQHLSKPTSMNELIDAVANMMRIQQF